MPLPARQLNPATLDRSEAAYLATWLGGMRLMDVRDTQETMLESRERGMTRIALLIAVLAAMLAIVEMGGGNAEQEALIK